MQTNSKSTKWGNFARLLAGLAFAAVGFLSTSPDTSDAVRLIGISVFGLAAIYFGLRLLPLRTHNRKVAASPVAGNVGAITVTHDDDSITVTFPNGRTRSVNWDVLTKIVIRTTDEGPVVDDVFWELYVGDALKLAYPQHADSDHRLLKAMQERLRGFDNEVVIEAMGSTGNANFTAWERVA
ncbi:hypothetical protein PHO31112_05018 [Pandoraea horticolens]|uniref:Transmembrane protein n=1 Tax=Pandoraea horticolens TaxID=2508298 RepID=A0A5E4Z3J8_9BURK|nr:hypothetical protein [Pandoraea horticolens]VVE55659.1 hypothetical protein PHO31112_05018 [Pandoraea horticolens]